MPAPQPAQPCSVDECGKDARKAGLCAEHRRKQMDATLRARTKAQKSAYDSARRRDQDFQRRHFRDLIKKKYGLSVEDYARMVHTQGFRCPVCAEVLDFDSKQAGAHVDHCHLTNAVRGILCCHCNRALGGARDRIAVLRALADYLEARR